MDLVTTVTYMWLTWSWGDSIMLLCAVWGGVFIAASVYDYRIGLR